MRLLWGLIWASSFFTLSLQKPRLLLFSPSVVHLGVPLSVGVQLQDVPRGQVVKGSVFLRNPSHNNVPCSPKVDFTLSSDRDFALLSLQVPLKDVKSCGLHQLLRRPEVQLVAQSPWLKDSLSRKMNIQGVNLLFSSRRGHLFLQTDQPIYNPGQRVRYRVFALDQKMRPSTDAITVTVENSHGLRVRKKDVYLPSSIFQDDFVIPDISEPGTWKISARFSDGLESNRSTQFEVKKYVLPNFEVKITPGKPYILTVPGHLDEIQLDIQARYIYGKPVQGVAYVRFGLLDEDGKKTFLRGLESQTKLVNGQSHISLSKAEFQDALGKLNMGMTDLLGLRLYVAAAIIESPGGEMEEAELTSWSFVSSPFSLDLSKTKRHLVPGAPFLLQALVREMSGSPASGIPVKVSATVSSPGSVPEVQNIQQNTDGSGQVSIPIIIPQTISELQLSVSAGSPYPAIARLTVAAPPSGGPGFLSIERPDSRPPRVGDTLNLNLRAVGSGATFSHYYYMILSRGQIVFMNREPKRTVTSVSVFVDHHLAPSFYFVAFYYHGDRPVANSLRVDVQAGACEGKLELSVDGAKEYRNGESVKLHLETDSPALVALGALDTALYAAGSKSHKPLNMGKVFEVMNSYDLGCGPGGGDSALQVFQAAGLAFSDGEQWTFSRKSENREGRGVGGRKIRKEEGPEGARYLSAIGSRDRTGLQAKSGCCTSGLDLLLHGMPHGQTVSPHPGSSAWLLGESILTHLKGPGHCSHPYLQGYMRIQQFRKADGSYAAWLSRDSSTWLTAFVLKVLSLAQEQVGGSPEKLQETSKWLLSQQQADGSFQDPCPVLDRNMQGGLVGSDETVALTAFVTIALHHGLAVFQDEGAEELKQRVEASISKANSFLGEKASAGLLGAHAAAITAYALTLTKAPGDLQGVAHNNLMAMAQETGDNLYWGSVTSSQSNAVSPTPAPRNPADPMPQAPALWIETTAYALLHLLLHEGKAEMADQTAAWLTRQGSFQGGFRSTQDTVIALDALSAYWIASHTTEERGLNVTLSSTGRSGFRSHALQLNNRQIRGLEEELQFSLGSKINVKVGGNSKGTLKVLRIYNVLDMKNTTCQDLQIEVTVKGHVEYTSEEHRRRGTYAQLSRTPGAPQCSPGVVVVVQAALAAAPAHGNFLPQPQSPPLREVDLGQSALTLLVHVSTSPSRIDIKSQSSSKGVSKFRHLIPSVSCAPHASPPRPCPSEARCLCSLFPTPVLPSPAECPFAPCSPQYLLDSNSWIEEMPSERLCRSTRQRAACAQLNDFLQEYGTQGCQV
ncbi:PREDICTED: complement C4-A [Cercocebus atys]|uniref:complement C4-A n=1 Tax=Cercocebus atys TaxID=9531 RepID=UPI0005F4843D|nr:PREDICTED: complement C4-A [Cercocebus atys]